MLRKAAPVPKSVQACQGGSWHIKFWKYSPDTGEVLKEGASPYRCLSWRCERCRRKRASIDFARMKAALMSQRPRDVLLLVLTLDPSERGHRVRGMRGGAIRELGAWKDPYEAFAYGGRCWQSFRQALKRAYGGAGLKTIKSWEVTRAGWPHLNVVIVCPLLADAVGGGWREREQTKAWIHRHARACGFGARFTIERARNRQAVAGYVTKTSGDLDAKAALYRAMREGRTAAEVVKLSQLPLQAPIGFRRWSATPNRTDKTTGKKIVFVPPRMKRPNVGGELVMSPLVERVRDADVVAVQVAPSPTTEGNPPRRREPATRRTAAASRAASPFGASGRQ